MKRVLLLLAAVLALTPAADAAETAGGILFSLPRPASGRIVFVRPDGSGLVDLTSNETMYETDFRSYSWSPDGRRIAFTSHRDGASSEEIYVMNPDGSGQQRLTFMSGRDSIFDFAPAWSPDGSTIAFVQDQNLHDSVWLMNPDGTSQRRLVDVGAIVRHLSWSPDSSRLLYEVQNAPPNRVEVVDVRTGAVHSLTPPNRIDLSPVWSPDGRYVAVASSGAAELPRIQVIDTADGSRNTVSSIVGGEPAWSPDGRRIAFTGSRAFPELANRFGVPTRLDLYVVDADGASQRRLTGSLGEEFGLDPGGTTPTWWPDGSRLFYLGGEGRAPATTTYVLNADGSCEQPFRAEDERPLVGPVWQPGATNLPPASRCADLRLSGSVNPNPVGLKAPVRLHLTLANDGNLTATGVHLRIEPPADASIRVQGDLRCSPPPLVCELPPLAPQTRTSLDFDVTSTTAGAAPTHLEVTADQPPAVAARGRLDLVALVLPCTLVGTNSPDRLWGTPSRDSICGLGGADRIDAGPGNDFVDGGGGADTIVGGLGRDDVVGGSGPDVVLLRDGARDTVSCGEGADVVVVDRGDRVDRDCEKVYRPPARKR
jgi:Tol biopolymer transport system component